VGVELTITKLIASKQQYRFLVLFHFPGFPTRILEVCNSWKLFLPQKWFWVPPPCLTFWWNAFYSLS